MITSIEVNQKLKELENDQKIIESHLRVICPKQRKVPFDIKPLSIHNYRLGLSNSWVIVLKIL